MLEKLLDNIITFHPIYQIKHGNSMSSHNREQTNDQTHDLFMKKNKYAEWDQSKLLVSIWETDSTKEMFDYQNKTVRVKEFKIQADHNVYISNIDKMNTKCIITKSTAVNDNLYCGSIERIKGQFYYIPGTYIECYKVIGNNQNCEYKLRAGDLIRIGRMRYFVKQTSNGLEIKTKQFNRGEKNKQISLKSLKGGTCKFCLCDEKDNTDLLISPCSCKGSCAQVHLNCLKQWLSNKVSRKSTSHVQLFNYDNFSCQICKDQLPSVLKIDGQLFNMLRQQNTSKDPYIILQGIPNDKSSTKNNLTIKMNYKQKTSLIIGRGHEADIRLEDVSISRQHCIIFYTNNNFFIVDNSSKFGTLLKIEHGQKVNLSTNKIQISKMILEMKKQSPQDIYLKYKRDNLSKK